MGEKTHTSKMVIPNDIMYLPAILAYVSEIARKCGFPPARVNRILLGVEEAASNIIEHAFNPGQEETFEIECCETALDLRIIMREKGIPFDPEQITQYVNREQPEEQSERGLGIFLMKKFMDDVSFVNRGRDGKETVLVAYRNTEPVENMIHEDSASGETQAADAPKKVTYDVRLMQPEEAVDVSKCAYHSYGYTYTHETIYYPSRIRELNISGSMISIVAVTESGEIIGHIALVLDEYDRSTAEGGIAFVKPSFRGQGCLNRLLDYMMEEGKQRGLTGIYGYATAAHPYSQKGIHKYGMSDCALLLSRLPEAEYKGIEQNSRQRRSSVYSFRYITDPASTVIHAPENHRDMLSQMYSALHVKPHFPDGSAASLPAQQVCRTKLSTDNFKTATIEILEYGSNAKADIKSMLKRLCAERLETIYLQLELADPCTAWMTAQFEELGFFFGGIMPGSAGKDRLVLQYLNNQVYDYGGLQMASYLGRDLLAYIKALDPSQ